MRKSKTLKKICTVAMVSVLSAAFAVSSAACSHKHTFADEWTTDGTYHWHVAECHEGVVADKEKHEFGTDDICDVCNYNRSTGTVNPYNPNNPSNPSNPSNPDNPDNPTNPSDPTVQSVTISFDSKGGSAIGDQTVNKGDKLQKPATPEKKDYMFAGWYTNEACTTAYDFNKAVTGGFTLFAKWVELNAAIKSYKGYNESLAVEWTGDASSSSVKYKEATASEWITLDAPLVRDMGGGVARADVIGLSAGDYNVKIEGSSTIELPAPISVTAYDRSGYAHFNRKTSEPAYEGVGAYNDDGTLKDGAIVIYVTEENKDYVMRDVAAAEAGVTMFQIPTYTGTTGKDWKGKDAEGIGWWLNNAQYSSSNAGSSKNKRPSNTYDPVNGGKLAFKSVSSPIAIRIIGKVTAPEGLTAPMDEDQGGSKDDGGYMARMKDLKNVTIEGVGENATIYGWGLHFLAGDSSNGQGSSFEVRNITFDKYVEDAVGMEGALKKGSYTEAPVSRCWVHNNVFLQGDGSAGGTQSLAASDKKEGDGSCDFKRGEYFTLSYNTFDNAHKTNLIGADTSNYQYNITFHHNWWNNCDGRVPYARNANIHFYNNYVSVETSNSYVHDNDGNNYLFSEGNYYMNCKKVTRPSSGTGKAWQNSYYGCYEENELVAAKTREEQVPSTCKYYDGTSLANFDTNPAVFYYDAQNKKSDCLLDDSVTARLKVLRFAGVNGWGTNNPKKQSSQNVIFQENMNEKTPDTAVAVPAEGTLTIDLSAAKANGYVNGVLFAAAGNKGIVKGKGQLVFFTLAAEAEVKFTAEGKVDDNLAELLAADGTVYANKASNATVVLPAGTYFISSGSGTIEGNNSKEVSITSLSFASTANTAKAKLETLNNAIEAIGEVTLSSGTAIANAKTLLSALNADEKTAFEAAYPGKLATLSAAEATLSGLQIADVIAKINAIGTVDDNSYPAINAARTAYDALLSAQRSEVTNYNVLTAAEDAWANRAVNAINSQITALEDVSAWTKANGKDAITAKKADYEAVKSAYDALSSKDGVVGYDKVTTGLTKLNGLLEEIATDEANAAKLADFREALAAITDVENSTLAQLSPVVAKYEALGALKDGLTPDEASKYASIKTKHTALAEAEAASIITVSFNGSKMTCDKASSINLTSSGSYKTGLSVKINNVSYTTGLKLQSSAGEVKFKLPTAKTLTIYVQSSSISVKINETKTATATAVTKDGYSGVYAITFNAQANVEYTIKKGDGEAYVLMMEFTNPASTSTASILDDEIDLVEAKSNED